jgi:hypothetical protein
MGRSVGRKIGVRFPAGVRDIYLFHNFQSRSVAHKPSYTMSTGGCLPGVKRPRHGADNSPQSSAEVKKIGAVAPLPRTPS